MLSSFYKAISNYKHLTSNGKKEKDKKSFETLFPLENPQNMKKYNYKHALCASLSILCGALVFGTSVYASGPSLDGEQPVTQNAPKFECMKRAANDETLDGTPSAEQCKIYDPGHFCATDAELLRELYVHIKNKPDFITKPPFDQLLLDVYNFLGGEDCKSRDPQYLPLANLNDIPCSDRYSNANVSDKCNIIVMYQNKFRGFQECKRPNVHLLYAPHKHFVYLYVLDRLDRVKQFNQRIVINTETEEDTLKMLDFYVENVLHNTSNGLYLNVKEIKGYFHNYSIDKRSLSELTKIKCDKVVIYFNDEGDTRQQLLNFIKTSGVRIVPKISAFYKTGLYEDEDRSSSYNLGVGLGYDVGSAISFTEIRARIIKNVLIEMTKLGESEQTPDNFIAKVEEAFIKEGIDPSAPHEQRI